MVYVHVPFCESFCTYCDFYSEVRCGEKGREVMEEYVRYICGEIDSRRDEIESTRTLNTLYFGGGTPSVLPLSCLGRIVGKIGGGPFREFTVEVNPEDIVKGGAGYVRGLLDLGVNRISMGVQSLDDGMLRWMNRRHSAAGAIEALRLLRSSGVGNVSVDVIYGVSGMTDAMLSDTLSGLLAFAPEHISAYQLSVEEGSALASMVDSGRYTEAGEEECRAQYELVCRTLSAAGYHHYEISNWAKPGFEAIHNSAYWRRIPYVGLGPGAHSLRVDGRKQVRSWNSQQLASWTRSSETLTEREIEEERMMLALRTEEGYGGRVLSESEWFVSDDIISDLFCDLSLKLE
ncbi:MAG: radical SAM family heme chaperone HemW [Bacteroidales bacterium]|nr:radical SAM family heme chaperone HemW [Bacteroidales bacterium]